MVKTWIKNALKSLLKRVFKKNDLRSGNNFDFEVYLTSHGFVLKSDKDNVVFYVNVYNNVMLTINREKSTVTMFSTKELFSKINFIPNSPLFTDIYVTKTIESVNEKEIL